MVKAGGLRRMLDAMLSNKAILVPVLAPVQDELLVLSEGFEHLF
jgi:hypothetical protein